MSVEFLFNLKEHCIETAAKKEFRKLTDELLNSPERDKEKERALEILHKFLSNTNFSQLRAQRPELSGGKDITVKLSFEKEQFKIEVINSDKSS